jgi:hypothetical protein
MLKKHEYLRAGWLLGLCAGLLFQPVCQAEESGWGNDRLVIKGFGTLGLARSDNDIAEYVRDLSQPRGLTSNWSSKVDSLVGLQANLKLGEQTEGVLQVISRYRYDGSYRPEISWAFLRHDFTPDFQMRVGRLGTEFYMLADSRLIGYANTTVRPPPDFYGPLVFSYLDGVDASASMSIGNGLLRAKAFAGYSPETTAFYEPVTWKLDGSKILGGHLDYFIGPWQFRIAHSQVKFSSHELPLNFLADKTLIDFGLGVLTPLDIVALAPELSTSRKTSHFDSIGAVFDQGPIQIQSMLGRIRHESAAYENSRAAFIIGSYRIGKTTPYIGFSTVKSSAKHLTSVLPPPIDGIAAGLMATPRMNQQTTTLGMRWDFQQNWALKLQLDLIRGKEDSIFLFRGPAPQWDGRMKVLSVALDFAF